MTRNNKCSFIDTDIIMKIGGFRGDKLLRKILTSFGYNLYLHEYLSQEELIIGCTALEQLQEMINSSEIIIVKEADLTQNEWLEYNSALTLLAREMGVDLNKKRDRNAGEIRSMAMAFAKDFEYFISDDGNARVAAKRHLQKLNGTYLQTIRMRDVILHIKNQSQVLEIDRKTAKQLYLYGTNPKLANNASEAKKLESIRESLKNDFDKNLWLID